MSDAHEERRPVPLDVLPEDDPHLAPAARHPDRVARVIGALFLVGFSAAVAFAVVYVVRGQSNEDLGLTMGLALFAIGTGLVAWGKYLVPRGPFSEERHPLRSADEDRRAFAAAFRRGGRAIERRSALGKLLGLALGAFGLAAVFPLRSLGPQPKLGLFTTAWRRGSRVVRTDGRPVHKDDLEVGGVMTVFPRDIFEKKGGPTDTDLQINMTILLRVATTPVVTKPGRETWSPDGYLAFSKMCTHAGCPVGLYEEETQQLLCPCHQSLFDVLDGAMPVFGPAPRPLPQLPLAVDARGYLYAQNGYDEPVGPGFWERM
jgi:ubiquinol-cytochrome c reductase iron-sulfur subunit